MSEHSTKSKPVDDEIDLGVVFEGIQNFLKKILKGVFNIISFFYRHKYVLIGLIVLGGVLGYFYDKNAKKTYTNDLLVTPNFGSSDYLYSKVEALDKKLNTHDSLFIKEIFGKQYKSLKSIEIEPVIDIYSFISQRESNKDLFELLFEEETSIEFLENPINSRNYKYHHIYLAIEGEENHRELANTLIDYMNSNTYFNDLKTLSLKNLNLQLSENRKTLKQIDTILYNERNNKSFSIDRNGMFFSDNTGLNELIIQKEVLVKQQQYITHNMVNYTNVIKLVDGNYKILGTKDFFNKSKVKLFPLLFVTLYCLIFLFRYIFIKAKSITS